MSAALATLPAMDRIRLRVLAGSLRMTLGQLAELPEDLRATLKLGALERGARQAESRVIRAYAGTSDATAPAEPEQGQLAP